MTKVIHMQLYCVHSNASLSLGGLICILVQLLVIIVYKGIGVIFLQSYEDLVGCLWDLVGG